MIYINHNEVLDGRVTIVDVAGSLNGETSTDFEEYIRKLIEKGIVYILMDARELSFVSSEGIGATLFIQKRIAEKNGFFVIFNLNDEISALYSLLGFDKIFRTAKSRIEAMEIMDRQMELRESGVSGEEDSIPDITDDEFHTIELEPDGPARSETEETDEKALVIECSHCQSLIRIKAPGDYLCPDCRAPFTADEDMAIHFE